MEIAKFPAGDFFSSTAFLLSICLGYSILTLNPVFLLTVSLVRFYCDKIYIFRFFSDKILHFFLPYG
jgi:hypothetical protein